ncbi:MAG: hypothetical protein B7Z80_02725 [Rhodospirillales bacterium 20-64-7]|nr:MAG: hypothetical protein B7Z80_02725 [Rhodospirillales bacterium 20-64-7]
MIEAQIEKPANAAPVTEAVIALVLLDKDTIKKDQDDIRKSLVKLDQQIHDNAIQCYLHAEKHGDTSLMRRLVVEIVGRDTGYRTAGLVGHMRMFTPMELVGDVIKLTGLDSEGNKRPWRIEEAAAKSFWTIRALDDKGLKPFFRETMVSKIEAARREWNRAKENTVLVDGKPQPKDKTKPFFDGQHMDAMDEFFSAIGDNLVKLNAKPDSSKDVYEARQNLKKAEAVAGATKLAG